MSEKIIRDIKRKSGKQYRADEKMRILVDRLRGEDGTAEFCPLEDFARSLYYKKSNAFMEAGNKRLTGDIRKIIICQDT